MGYLAASGPNKSRLTHTSSNGRSEYASRETGAGSVACGLIVGTVLGAAVDEVSQELENPGTEECTL